MNLKVSFQSAFFIPILGSDILADEEVKTLAVKLALEDGTFQQGMRNLKGQLSVADSEFKATGGSVKNFGSTLDGVKANATALSEKINIQKEIVSQYRAKLLEAQETLQKHSETMMENKAAMEQAQSEYQKNVEALGKNSEETKKSKQNLDEQTDAYKRSEAQVRSNEKSVNGYTIQMNKATGEVKRMESELSKSNGFAVLSQNLEKSGKKIESTGKKISGAGQSLTFGLSIPIAATGVACVKMASDFETSSAKVSTISDETVMSMDKMKQGALDLSTSTHDDINDINQAFYQAMSAGIKTSDSLKFVGDAVKLAKGGFTDTTTAVNTLTSVLNAYHMKASEANTISDQLIKTQDLGKTTVGELGQSLGQVIPIAASLHVKTQDLFSSIAELTKNGMPASEAIVAVRAALSSVLKPSKDTAMAAKQMGLNFSAAHLQNVGFAKFIDEIAKATGGNAQKMSELFKNVRALNGMTVLAGSSNEDFNQTLKNMSGATGATNDAFEKMESTGAAKLGAAINTLKNDGIRAGEDLMPAVAKVADSVANLADRFSQLSPQEQETILKIAGITALIGPLMQGVGGLTQGIGLLSKGFGGYVGIIGKVCDKLGWAQKATKGVQAATEAAMAVEGAAATATEAEGVAAAGAAGSTAAFSASLLPVIGIAAAVVGGIALIVWVCTQLHNYLSQKSIPAVQLFGKETSTATKKAVSSYMDLDKKASESLMDLQFKQKNTTKKSASELESTYDQMGKKITEGMDKHYSDDLQAAKKFFSSNTGLSAKEQSDILSNMTIKHTQQAQSVKDCESQIQKLLKKSQTDHGQALQDDYNNIAKIQKNMQGKAIDSLSQSEIEARGIRERMKTQAGNLTAQEAADVVKNAKSAKDGSIKAADEKYNKTVGWASYEHDVMHSISDKQYSDIVKSAGKTRDDSVKSANKMFDDTVSAAKAKTPDFVGQIDWQTGQVKGRWDILVGKAQQWGTDFINNLTAGFIAANPILSSALDSIGGTIAAVFKHSVPKEGPLKDDDVWTVHMMENFENGIKKGTPNLVRQATSTAAAIRDAMSVPNISNISGRIQGALSNMSISPAVQSNYTIGQPVPQIAAVPAFDNASLWAATKYLAGKMDKIANRDIALYTDNMKLADCVNRGNAQIGKRYHRVIPG